MKCTYCGSERFYEGPSGGASTNVLCANDDCRHWFNVDPWCGLEDLNRVQPPPGKEKILPTVDQVKERYIREGRECYLQGGPLAEILESKPGWHACTGADLYRIAGWLEESDTRPK